MRRWAVGHRKQRGLCFAVGSTGEEAGYTFYLRFMQRIRGSRVRSCFCEALARVVAAEFSQVGLIALGKR